ncbi:flagellar protein FlgN [Moorella sp. Hama-1]|uniref:flagellar protein FlgN n=1 Tax=Moorella sp. Hama-1 TaxID=2138101 RepID=UPI000D649EA5|nr:flagellar protein FlgN [Moorella sp. Hama-1]BCV20774.1 FlgN protein [Moorella sp. Hama-1]
MRSLAEVLQVELEVVQQLITACRDEQGALVTNDLAGIQAATGRKGDLARYLATLEEERRQVVETSPDASVYDDGINHLRDALKQTVREFQEINETNRLLTRQSLAYVQKILSLLVPEGTPAGIMDRVV